MLLIVGFVFVLSVFVFEDRPRFPKYPSSHLSGLKRIDLQKAALLPGLMPPPLCPDRPCSSVCAELVSIGLQTRRSQEEGTKWSWGRDRCAWWHCCQRQLQLHVWQPWGTYAHGLSTNSASVISRAPAAVLRSTHGAHTEHTRSTHGAHWK